MSLKIEKWISAIMKNKNKIHIHLVNYIRNFFYCAYPYVIIFWRTLIYIYIYYYHEDRTVCEIRSGFQIACQVRTWSVLKIRFSRWIWKMYKWIRKKKRENLQDVKLVQTRCQNVSMSKFCQKLIAVVDGPAIGQPWWSEVRPEGVRVKK